MACTTIGRFTYDSTTAQTVSAGQPIQFNLITLSDGCVAYNGNGQIIFKKPGTYLIEANFVATATAAGNIAIAMLENGTQKPGAQAQDTAAAVGNESNLSFNTVTTVESQSGSGYATITFPSLTASSFIVANVVIIKVD